PSSSVASASAGRAAGSHAIRLGPLFEPRTKLKKCAPRAYNHSRKAPPTMPEAPLKAIFVSAPTTRDRSLLISTYIGFDFPRFQSIERVLPRLGDVSKIRKCFDWGNIFIG